MIKALEMFKTIANKVDDFIYFGIIALLIYYYPYLWVLKAIPI